MSFRPGILSAAFLTLAAPAAHAGICDYRLSNLLGGAGTKAVELAKDGGGVLKEAGVLTLNNAVTGAGMLGSAFAGSSGAGVAGAAASAAPIGLAVGAAVLGSEAICYFLDERITDYDQVMIIINLLAADADPQYFELVVPDTPIDMQEYILVKDPEKGTVDKYMVTDLYIVNGVLKNRDKGRNTVIGNIGFVAFE
ncbi:hypothetical protein [Pseudooceanicola sp. LIPI14-2-Ac024]|uniref:hypothetical protein n=1 Tax=Pseudooceanicola sp. LIPI14-2-Ac024 TaxID=3344875 RepID=UPI0035D03B34